MNADAAHVLPSMEAADELVALMARIRAREQHALTRLYDLTADRVYGVALRVMGNVHDAEEIVCDVFQQVWQRAAQFMPERGTALRWLLVIAHSRALDARRRLRPERLTQPLHPEGTEAAYTDDEARPVEELLDVLRGGTAVHRAMSELGDEQRKLIALAFFAGLSHQEIAERVGMPLGTVKSHIRRGLARLREYLDRRGVGCGG